MRGPRVAAALLALAALSCRPSAEAPEPATIEAAQALLSDRLIDDPDVSALGIATCDGNPCVKVYVVRMDAPVVSAVPRKLGAFPVVVEVAGEVRGGGRGN